MTTEKAVFGKVEGKVEERWYRDPRAFGGGGFGRWRVVEDVERDEGPCWRTIAVPLRGSSALEADRWQN